MSVICFIVTEIPPCMYFWNEGSIKLINYSAHKIPFLHIPMRVDNLIILVLKVIRDSLFLNSSERSFHSFAPYNKLDRFEEFEEKTSWVCFIHQTLYKLSSAFTQRFPS